MPDACFVINASQKSKLANKNMRCMQPAICMEKKMGESLEGSKVLQ
jgi:hypothetical protein